MPRKSKGKSKRSRLKKSPGFNLFQAKSPVGPILLLVGLALGFVVGGITKPDVPTLSPTEQEQPATQTVIRVIDGIQ